MPSRRGQVASGLSMITWGALLIIVLIIGTTVAFYVREKVDDKIQQNDDAIDWEAGYLAAALAEHPFDHRTIAEFLASEEYDTRQHKEALSNRLVELSERVRVNTSGRDASVCVLVVRESRLEIRVRAQDPSRAGDFCHIMIEQGEINEWLASGLETVYQRLSARFDDQNGGVGIVAVPGESQAALIVAIRRYRQS